MQKCSDLVKILSQYYILEQTINIENNAFVLKVEDKITAEISFIKVPFISFN